MGGVMRMQHLAHAFRVLGRGKTRRRVQHATHPVTNVSRDAGGASDFSY